MKILFAIITVGLLASANSSLAQVKLGVKAGNRVIETLKGTEVVGRESVPGAAIEEVLPGSTAESLKLQKGDLIRGVVSEGPGKRRIDSIDDLVWVMKNSTRPPTEVYLYRKDAKNNDQFLKMVLEKVERLEEVRETSLGGPPRIRQIKVMVLVPKFVPAKLSELDDAKSAK